MTILFSKTYDIRLLDISSGGSGKLRLDCALERGLLSRGQPVKFARKRDDHHGHDFSPLQQLRRACREFRCATSSSLSLRQQTQTIVDSERSCLRNKLVGRAVWLLGAGAARPPRSLTRNHVHAGPPPPPPYIALCYLFGAMLTPGVCHVSLFTSGACAVRVASLSTVMADIVGGPRGPCRGVSGRLATPFTLSSQPSGGIVLLSRSTPMASSTPKGSGVCSLLNICRISRYVLYFSSSLSPILRHFSYISCVPSFAAKLSGV